ncbi:serine/threonine-protein kinase [Serinibacter arcticus]|uniref:Tyrosine protein kinase:Serine/threonine protein kinase n=1 Tax=Serinibacter arcticus TaxID=1655435 RepID=A0A4Z1E5P7_9MICO|nr:serine/threonine-protein kinase [Serinibacter arcticus]TGO06459.1 Tyrosine protein kinase:Serine/threonine protein kinase [Serinibacter arcticus]
MVRAGDEVGGYTLVHRLGAGGMGTVWEARDAVGTGVALKLLHPAISADPQARSRLDREVASLHRVRGSRVARVLDAEVEDDLAFIVTELVEGLSLEESVAAEGAFDPVDLHPLARDLHEAVTQVHDAGLLHRDLKPGNVMVTYDGPVLIDFGIAQLVDDDRLTHAGFVTGTPGFLDPATLTGGALGHAGDWFGWAAVMLYAATGRPPFGRGPMEAVLGRMTTARPDVDGLAPAVAAAFRHALAPDPRERTDPLALLRVLENDALGIDQPVPEPTRLVPPPPGPVGAAPLAAAAGPATTAVPPPPGPVWRGGAPEAATAVVAPRPAAGPPVATPGGVPSSPPGPAVGPAAVPWIGADVVAPPAWALPPRPQRALVVSSGAFVVALAIGWPGVASATALLGFVLLTSIGLVERRTRARRLGRGPRRSDGWAAAGWTVPMVLLGLVTSLVPLGVGAVVAASLWWLGSSSASGDLVGGLPSGWGELVTPLALAAGLTAAWWVPVADATRSGARTLWRAVAPTATVRQVWVLVLVGLAVALVLVGLAGIGGPAVWAPFPDPPPV